MIPIKDLNDYTAKMAAVIKDKLFFVDKVNVNIYVDYGCADGTLLQQLDNIYNDPDKVYIGFDYSNEMISLAKSKWSGVGKVYFTNSFDTVLNVLNNCEDKTSCLILSSVLHEVFSQGIEPVDFWNNIVKDNYKYIVIRDMAYNKLIDNYKIEQYQVAKVQCANPELVKEFVKKYGKLSNPVNFCHYLLKYSYTQNWKRELEENYFSFNPDIAINYLQEFSYYPIYLERFNVDFICNRIYEHFRIDLRTIGQTHIKLILQK